jgi:DNA mismatch repair ATPase MutS
VALTIGQLIAWFAWDIGFTPFLAALIIEIGVAVWLSHGTGEVLEAVEKAARDLHLLTEILARLEIEPVKAERLRRLRATLDTAGLPPSRRIAHLRRLIDWLNADQNQLFTPIALLLLWRIRFAFALDAWRAKYGSVVAGWLQAVGEYEALCSLAAYAYENPADPFPDIVDQGASFSAEAVGHPLIPVSRCVRNDVQLGGDLRVLVVSGSNMSGKSTMLRTVGINTVLALAGAPVRAKSLRVSLLAIGATLRIQDSLQAGKSRFFAEITRLRQLVDLARGPSPLLFLLDEILHGTNSHDRRHGAEALVRGLVDLGAIGLLTTHDLALAEIVERLGPRAANVHFEDELVNGAVTFDYRMRPGVTQHSNALALMRTVGLDV